MLSLIPLSFTYGNLFSGVIGILFVALKGDVNLGAMLILLAVVFDYLDGKIARLLNVESKVGEYLDSLSDIISFGLLPLVIFIKISGFNMINIFIALIFMASASYRLARYHSINFSLHNMKNVDNKKHKKIRDYVGMPITMNGIVVPILVFFFKDYIIYWIILSSILMVSKINIKKI